MIRRTHLNLEPLEGRALLSGLAYSLTTNQSVYHPGQPVEMTFQETNVSGQPLAVEDGPSIDGFTVTRDGTPVWQSNAGVNPLFIAAETLQPGQSLTLTATWDGIPTGGSAPASGTFMIVNQLNPKAATASVTINNSTSTSTPSTDPAPVSSPPVKAPMPVPGSSPIAVSVSTNHPAYQRGHRVRMTVTLHRVSKSPVDLAPDSNVDGITVFEGSTEVWHSARLVSGPASRSLKPGQSIKLTAVWNGRPDQAGVSIAPGTYTIEAGEGGYSGSTTFRIVG